MNFGAFPGTAEARATVSGQTSILAASGVDAWVRCESSADHSADEHEIEDFEVFAKEIVAGNGFTAIMRPREGRCYGVYNFTWVWN